MIYGVGVDITKVDRFKKWVKNPDILQRFFNSSEQSNAKNEQAKMEHYAARFAAKEAFGKALGTGVTAFKLTEVYIAKDEMGKPLLQVTGSAEKLLKEKCGNCNVQVSLSHEKDNAIAFVIIEKL